MQKRIVAPRKERPLYKFDVSGNKGSLGNKGWKGGWYFCCQGRRNITSDSKLSPANDDLLIRKVIFYLTDLKEINIFEELIAKLISEM